jgi:hypothetical protein
MNIVLDVKKYLDKLNSYNKYTIISNSHNDLYLLFKSYGKKKTKAEINKQILMREPLYDIFYEHYINENIKKMGA